MQCNHTKHAGALQNKNVTNQKQEKKQRIKWQMVTGDGITNKATKTTNNKREAEGPDH